MLSGTAAGVEFVKRPDGRVHLSGLQTCGSVWACPMCSEKVLAGRADELLSAIETWSGGGGRVALLTLTMRHRAGQGLADLWDALTAAWRAAYGNRGHRDLLRGSHWARRVEATVGENGWHLHVHALLFVPDGVDVDALGAAMFGAWSKRLQHAGLEAPVAHLGGLDVKLLDVARAPQEVAEYLAKGHYEAADDAPTERRLAALELASSGKRARGSNRTPMQVLAHFVRNGLASDAETWREWETASHGRRALTWSSGARKLLVRDDGEKSDEELAQESDGVGVTQLVLPFGTYLAALRVRHLVPRLMTLAETADDAEDARGRVARHLGALGLADEVWAPPDDT